MTIADVTGLKYFEQLASLFARLHDVVSRQVHGRFRHVSGRVLLDTGPLVAMLGS